MIEIMLAVGIIVILSAIAIPNMIAYRKTVHAKSCADNIHLIQSACYANRIRTGRMETDLDALVGVGGKGFLKWKPQCPVGGEYTITYDDATDELTITCSKYDADDHNVTSEQ